MARSVCLVRLHLIGLLCGAFFYCAAGAAPSAGPRPVEVVRFQADHDYPPFSLQNPARGATGYDVELFRKIASESGVTTEIKLDDWQAVVERVDRGEVDVVPMLVTPERQARYLFTQPVLQRYHLVFGRRGDEFVSSIQELTGKRVAVQRSGRAWEALVREPGITLILVDREGDSLRAVEQGLADVAVAPSFIGAHAKRRYGLDQIVPLSSPLLSSDYAFALPKDRADLKDRLNKGIELTVRSGSAEQVYMEWLGVLAPSEKSYRSGLVLGLFVALPLLVAASFFLFRWRRARAVARDALFLQRHAEEEAARLLNHDPITGGANAAALRAYVCALIRDSVRFGLIRVDILDFAQAESIAGHEFADRVLAAVAERLATEGRVDLVATGDRGTFYVVDLRLKTATSAAPTMNALLKLTSRRLEIGDVSLELSCAAGAALFPFHGSATAALVRAAGIACSAAASSPGTGALYNQGLDPDPRSLTLLGDLRRAISESTLGFALQAKRNIRAGKICGAEMLVRWSHPLYGNLPPADFIPLAERGPVMGELTTYLIEKAIDLCTKWGEEGFAIELAVNISANDLTDPAVVAGIRQRVKRHKARLMLEITETAVMRDAEHSLQAVELLRAEGVRISLDDFGTGNASLTYLKQLRPDEVKIDRTFIAHVTDSAADQAIVKSTIELAHSLGATVTAEGVEDAATLLWLEVAGADSAQGYFVGRPEAPESFRERLQQEQ